MFFRGQEKTLKFKKSLKLIYEINGQYFGIIIFKHYVSLFKDNKADVILKYNADEARSLKAYGELPEHGNV